MKACTLIFTPHVGTTTQTVTGVNDLAGNPFVGKVAIIHGNSAINVINGVAGAFTAGYRRSFGFDNLTEHLGWSTEETNAFNLKIVDNGGGSKSLLDIAGTIGFGGVHQRSAYISAFRSGEFDVSYDFNSRTGDSYTITVLGGDELQHQVGICGDFLATSTLSFAFDPVALLLSYGIRHALSTGAGGANMPYGWGVRNISAQSFRQALVQNQSTNSRKQLPGQILDGLTANTWGAGFVTLSSNPGSSTPYLVIGGVQARAGVIYQPAFPGAHKVVTGLNNRAVFLSSYGAAASGIALTDQAEWAFGMMDGTRQGMVWVGENTNGNVMPLHGARYTSDTSILKFGVPNGSSTTFTAGATAVGFDDSDSSFTINWGSVDGVSREVLWLALGDEAAPPPPPPPPPPPEGCPVFLPPGEPGIIRGCISNIPAG